MNFTTIPIQNEKQDEQNERNENQTDQTDSEYFRNPFDHLLRMTDYFNGHH
jgi:hypothetical protein